MPDTVKPPATASRAVRKRERTRRGILEAARRLCAQGGYGSVTVADIAAAADVGVGTFYYHFETKDHILVALMEEFLAEMAETIRRRREVYTDIRERLRAGYRMFFNLSPENQELLRMYFSSAGARAGFAEGARQLFLSDTVDLIEAGQAVGVFRAGDAHLLANWMIGATSEALQWLLARDESISPDAADMLADLMLHGLEASGGGAQS